MIIKFTDHKYAQAHMEPIHNGLALYSYTTCVATLQDGWLHINGLYSMTTRRHIGAFMKEYVEWPNGEHGDYYTAKHCYEGNYRLNINTGEVEEL